MGTFVGIQNGYSPIVQSFPQLAEIWKQHPNRKLIWGRTTDICLIRLPLKCIDSFRNLIQLICYMWISQTWIPTLGSSDKFTNKWKVSWDFHLTWVVFATLWTLEDLDQTYFVLWRSVREEITVFIGVRLILVNAASLAYLPKRVKTDNSKWFTLRYHSSTHYEEAEKASYTCFILVMYRQQGIYKAHRTWDVNPGRTIVSWTP